ncbi:MAG: phosphatidylserine decarboxylase [Planctomycetota bacterium]
MLSSQAKGEWVAILAIGGMLTVASAFVWAWGLLLFPLVTLAVLLFFRDPPRRTPSQRRVLVSPSDGRVSSIHRVDRCDAVDGPAMVVRVFISLLDVHVLRSPCHASVEKVRVAPGKHRSALHPRSPEENTAVMTALAHPVKGKPVAAVRMVAGLFARSIDVFPEVGSVIQRGERIGIIKLGSTAELYVPERLTPEAQVEVGQRVKAGVTVLVQVASESETDGDAENDDDTPAEQSPPFEALRETSVETEAAVAQATCALDAEVEVVAEVEHAFEPEPELEPELVLPEVEESDVASSEAQEIFEDESAPVPTAPTVLFATEPGAADAAEENSEQAEAEPAAEPEPERVAESEPDEPAAQITVVEPEPEPEPEPEADAGEASRSSTAESESADANDEDEDGPSTPLAPPPAKRRARKR